MGHQRRMHQKGRVYFLTNRLAEGLPLVPTPFINHILLGILARASSKYSNIVISAWGFLNNHYHAVIVCNGAPAEFKDFINYVNGETAKSVCRILGKRNVKIWAQRTHIAPLLTSQTVLEKLAYVYLNPVEAGLVAECNEWPGVSTFEFLQGDGARRFPWIKPSLIPKLPNKRFPLKESRRLLSQVQQKGLPEYDLNVSPFAWKSCFHDSASVADSELLAKVLERIAAGERLNRERRIKEKSPMCSRKQLMEQNPHRPYKPTNFGRRMYCISTCQELRKEFIQQYESFCEAAAIAWQLAKQGFREVPFPPGAFLPPQLPRASALHWAT